MNQLIKKLQQHIDDLDLRRQEAARQEAHYRTIAETLEREHIKLANTLHEIQAEVT